MEKRELNYNRFPKRERVKEFFKKYTELCNEYGLVLDVINRSIECYILRDRESVIVNPNYYCREPLYEELVIGTNVEYLDEQ